MDSENITRLKTERPKSCSLSNDVARQINLMVSTTNVENCNKTEIGGINIPEGMNNDSPSMTIEEIIEISIHGPTTIETADKIPKITVVNINKGPVIQMTDEMVEKFHQEGTLEHLLKVMVSILRIYKNIFLQSYKFVPY